MDTNEIERLKKESKKYRDELNRLLEERSEYLRVSAHQMKSPIATIRFSIDALLGEYAGRLNSRQIRILESIKRGSGELQDLIIDILELERFRVGEVKSEIVNFSEICIQALEELMDKIKEKDIDLESDIPRESLFTSGNRVGLKQTVHNLIENAIKYSEKGGSVRLHVEFDEEQKQIKCTIEDGGIGIPEEAQGRIFDEFYRAPNARKFDRSGSGFGLAIVKQVVEMCKGSIDVQSRENQGTRITFTLPLIEIRAPEPQMRPEKISRKRIVVVGGVAAGPKSASRARRLDPHARITVFEKGSFLAYAGCALPHYISGKIKNQRDLFTAQLGFQNATEFFRHIKGIEIKNLCEVVRIDREKKVAEYRDMVTDRVFEEPYDVLILATGSRSERLDIPGAGLGNIFSLHGVRDSEKIKSSLANEIAKDIVIVGGGIIGIETAEALTVSGARITIVEKMPEILPFLDPEVASLVRRYLELKGVRFITGETVKAFHGNAKVEFVQLSRFRLPADLVIVATGFKPNVELAGEAGLTIGSTGAISVNEYLQTNDPSIYAAGDCAEHIHAVTDKPFSIPLGSLANRMGRVAGSNAVGRREGFGKITGTIIIHVFDYHIAKTGLSESEASRYGFDPVSCYVPDYDKDQFMTNAEMICIKMTADRKTQGVLGVQIVGKGEVAKRIDVAATVIARKGKVEDIIDLDLGYAPAYSQAIDNIIVAAHVLQNKLDGVLQGVVSTTAQELLGKKKECVCIDVRSPQEFEEERIPGFISIPLESLRRRIDEIPRDRPIILVCKTGAKSYQASLILEAHGFKQATILEGGLAMWPFKVSRD